MKSPYVITWCLSMISSFCFSRVAGCSLEYAAYWGVGVAAVMVSLHRIGMWMHTTMP